jgi:hypothetical protein
MRWQLLLLLVKELVFWRVGGGRRRMRGLGITYVKYNTNESGMCEMCFGTNHVALLAAHRFRPPPPLLRCHRLPRCGGRWKHPAYDVPRHYFVAVAATSLFHSPK